MNMEISGKAKGQVVIIEGPDGVGKTTFIKHLCEFLRGEGAFKTLLTADEIEQANKAKPTLKGARQRRRAAERKKFNKMLYSTAEQAQAVSAKYPGGHVFGTHATILKSIMENGVPFSFYVANIRDGSPENRDFYKRLLAGEITDERKIVQEYLQAHWDLHNYIEQLRDMHDLVIVDRALPSMFVSQIRACGQTYAEPNYNMLLDRTGQYNHLLWILDAPDEVIMQRCDVRGNDAQGEKLHARLQTIKAAYRELQQSGKWPKSQFIDVSSPEPHSNLALFTQLASNVISYTRQFSLMR